jgi:hypothetical protein
MGLPGRLRHCRTDSRDLGRHCLGCTAEMASAGRVTKACKAKITNEDVIVLAEKKVLRFDVIMQQTSVMDTRHSSTPLPHPLNSLIDLHSDARLQYPCDRLGHYLRYDEGNAASYFSVPDRQDKLPAQPSENLRFRPSSRWGQNEDELQGADLVLMVIVNLVDHSGRPATELAADLVPVVDDEAGRERINRNGSSHTGRIREWFDACSWIDHRYAC